MQSYDCINIFVKRSFGSDKRRIVFDDSKLKVSIREHQAGSYSQQTVQASELNVLQAVISLTMSHHKIMVYLVLYDLVVTD